MPTKLNLPRLSDLSEDSEKRYSELENNIRKLERRIKRRIGKIQKSVDNLREQEEILLKKEGIDYEYFGYDEEVEPRDSDGYVVETLAGHMVLYDIDEATYESLSIKMAKKLGTKSDYISEKMEPIREIGMCYDEFLTDFAVRYAAVTPIGAEDYESPYSLVHCIGNNGMVIHAQVDAKIGFLIPIHEEEGTLDEYLNREKQDELILDHAMCDHNQHIVSHPSDLFEHFKLATVLVAVMQDRYFEMNPAAKTEAEIEEEVSRAQGIGSIFSAIGRATRDPLGVSGSDDDDGMLN